MMRLFMGIALLFASFAAHAETPAPWLIDHQRCLGEKANDQLAKLDKKLSSSESRALAEVIYWECAVWMPNEMLPEEKIQFVHRRSQEFAKSLRWHSAQEND
ncbi:hypothetical protein [Paraurantiacibacter namhicola]|uniref:hypothetical protein n=1 Tax=Paraurantiacibacter namhicola TaxID=645517 RepID=UPI0012ED6509|nr:hypothetical protein [Paraurantiacibacter namhicola]